LLEGKIPAFTGKVQHYWQQKMINF